MLGDLGQVRGGAARFSRAKHHENEHQKVVTRAWHDEDGYHEESYPQATTQWTRFEYKRPQQEISVLHGGWIISGKFGFKIAAELDIQLESGRRFFDPPRKEKDSGRHSGKKKHPDK
jgi:hypothetical protein